MGVQFKIFYKEIATGNKLKNTCSTHTLNIIYATTRYLILQPEQGTQIRAEYNWRRKDTYTIH